MKAENDRDEKKEEGESASVRNGRLKKVYKVRLRRVTRSQWEATTTWRSSSFFRLSVWLVIWTFYMYELNDMIWL